MGKKCGATGKVIFPTKGEGVARMIEIKKCFHYLKSKIHIKHRLGKPALVRVYYCPYCSGYHLTSWDFQSAKAAMEQKSRTRYIIQDLLQLVRITKSISV